MSLKFLTPNICKTLTTNMHLGQFKLKLGTLKIIIITNLKFFQLTKKALKSKASVLIQNCAQVDTSKLIWLENPISNQWTTNITQQSATSGSKALHLISCFYTTFQLKMEKLKNINKVNNQTNCSKTNFKHFC